MHQVNVAHDGVFRFELFTTKFTVKCFAVFVVNVSRVFFQRALLTESPATNLTNKFSYFLVNNLDMVFEATSRAEHLVADGTGGLGPIVVDRFDVLGQDAFEGEHLSARFTFKIFGPIVSRFDVVQETRPLRKPLLAKVTLVVALVLVHSLYVAFEAGRRGESFLARLAEKVFLVCGPAKIIIKIFCHN